MAPLHSFTQLLGDTFGPALIVLSGLTAAELMWPRGERAAASRLRGVVIWLIYIPYTVVLAKLFAALWALIGLQPVFTLRLDFSWAGVLGMIAAPVAGAMVYDLFFYLYHRAQHRWLWRWHAVHHSIRDLNAVNSYHHIAEPALQSVFIIMPATLLFCDTGSTIPLMAVLLRVHASWIHSPTQIHLGPLRALICDNRFHRIHHSLEEHHFDRNFGAFTTLWDRLFGTAHFPHRHEWPDTGLSDVPEPASIRAWLALPFTIGKDKAEEPAALPVAPLGLRSVEQ